MYMQNVSPTSEMPGMQKQGASPELRNRLVLLSLPIAIVLLIGGGLIGLQAASQRGLQLGYASPLVHIVSSVQGPASVGQAIDFVANSPGRDLVYSWDFGDGTTGTGADVTHSYSNEQALESNNFTYTVSVTVRDPLGRTSSETQNLKVLPQMPTAAFTYNEEVDSYYGQYNQYVDFDASASTFHTQNVSYSWTFGDGSSDNTSSSSERHYFYYTGTYTVTLTVSDDAGQTSTFDMSVTVQ